MDEADDLNKNISSKEMKVYPYGNKSRNGSYVSSAFSLSEEAKKSWTFDINYFRNPKMRQSNNLKGVWQQMSTGYGTKNDPVSAVLKPYNGETDNYKPLLRYQALSAMQSEEGAFKYQYSWDYLTKNLEHHNPKSGLHSSLKKISSPYSYLQNTAK